MCISKISQLPLLTVSENMYRIRIRHLRARRTARALVVASSELASQTNARDRKHGAPGRRMGGAFA